MKRLPLFVFTLLLTVFPLAELPLSAADSARLTRTQQLAEQNDASGPLSGSVWGFLAVNLRGDTLACINPGRRLVPASNLKLITTGAALLSLGGNYRYTTTLATDAPIPDPSAASTLEGNLYIIGGGDPMLGELFPYLPGADGSFAPWLKLLKDNGIEEIDGDIIGDGSWFGARQYHPDWCVEDIATRDGVVPVGLTWRGRMEEEIPDGAYSAAYHFQQWLNEVDSTATAADGTVAPSPRLPVSGIALEGPAPDSLIRTLGVVESLPLRDLIRIANCQSDNFIAETLLKTLGKTASGDDSYAPSLDALKKALSPLGLMSASGQMRFADGSGLSRKNYVSPEFMVSFLRAMSCSKVWNDYLASLPFAGEPKTTLERRLPRRPYALRHRIRMKSGSMNGVRCFSGYILPATGGKERTIVFSILTNNAVAQGQQVYQIIDQMVESLAHENE